MDALYDVAISFLSRDEPLAVRIHNELRENLSVFVYTKRQEELAGTDGLESWRQAFFSKSRLVIILYRDGWGKTRWTAVEELAIKDRAFNGAWNSLLLVMLDENSPPPSWIPETHIRLNYTKYGNSLIGAIKMRAEELGCALKVETATERATRVQSIELARTERDQLLSYQGMAAARTEVDNMRHELDEKLADIQLHLTTINLEHGADNREYVIRTEQAALNFYPYFTSPATQSRIVVQEFDRALMLPDERANRMYIPGEEPHPISKSEFYFDYDAAYGWCWRARDARGNLLTTSGLCEHLLKSLLELHEQLTTGKKVRRRAQAYGRGGTWS